MLMCWEEENLIRLTRAGRLLPWLGPALRGLMARHFKASVCHYSLQEQNNERRHCRGCPSMGECAYGQLLEPDPPTGSQVFIGQKDVARPLVLSPSFPLPTRGEAELTFPVRWIAIGSAAREHLPLAQMALQQSGEDPYRGLGRDHITFELVDEDPQLSTPRCHPIDLPLGVDAVSGTVPWLGVDLTSPLFLTSRVGGRKELIERPRFVDLLCACFRALGALFRAFDEPLEADFAGMKAAAAQVPLVESHYRLFNQSHYSSRSHQRSRLRGITGSGVYRQVPLALVKWLTWGGRAHVGTSRVAGAGGWRTVWSHYQGTGPVPKESWQSLS